MRRYHNEAEITSTKKEYTCIEDEDTYRLIVKQATTQMTGVYKCKAQNEIGSTETKANLTVHGELEWGKMNKGQLYNIAG